MISAQDYLYQKMHVQQKILWQRLLSRQIHPWAAIGSFSYEGSVRVRIRPEQRDYNMSTIIGLP